MAGKHHPEYVQRKANPCTVQKEQTSVWDMFTPVHSQPLGGGVSSHLTTQQTWWGHCSLPGLISATMAAENPQNDKHAFQLAQPREGAAENKGEGNPE